MPSVLLDMDHGDGDRRDQLFQYRQFIQQTTQLSQTPVWISEEARLQMLAIIRQNYPIPMSAVLQPKLDNVLQTVRKNLDWFIHRAFFYGWLLIILEVSLKCIWNVTKRNP